MTKTVETQCGNCGGTGLYQGMAEKKGCAVICYSCSGTGMHKISYTPFKERKLRKDIKRVFKDSCGYMHAPDDIVASDTQELIKFSEGGCTYEEFLAGKKPKPVKQLYCPYLWTGQNLQNKDKNNLYQNHCSKNLKGFGSIYDCKKYKTKSKCWDIYEGK
jgi:hypothetical protein